MFVCYEETLYFINLRTNIFLIKNVSTFATQFTIEIYRKLPDETNQGYTVSVLQIFCFDQFNFNFITSQHNLYCHIIGFASNFNLCQ